MPTENFSTKLTNYLDAGYTFLAIESHEELRVLAAIRAVARTRTCINEDDKTIPLRYGEWDCIGGLEMMTFSKKGEVTNAETINASNEPIKALMQIGLKDADPGIYVMKDMHPYIGKDTVCRKIRNIEGILKEKGSTVIFLSPRISIPSELSKDVQQLSFELPTRADLAVLFESFVDNSVREKPQYRNLKLDDGYPAAVAEAAMGMSEMEADNAFGLATIAINKANGSLTFNGEFTRRVFEEKIATLRNTALEYMPLVTGFEQIGGMDNLKLWAMQRRLGFEAAARARNLPFPKGILLAGIKGTGKTVTAMAIAKEFRFPLFKLDVGKLFASKVGETEALTRELIRILDGLGRAVILLDEIEKSFNTGATSGGGDSGVSSRLFGALISWMSLKTCPVFIVGTLNDHQNIPPELLRKGRFDEVWWVDLPDPTERMAIFDALLKNRYKPDKWSGTVTKEVLDATRDFTGAEIEAAIQEALYFSLSDESEFDLLLLKACQEITPQAQLDPTGLDAMRQRAKAFKPASSVSGDKLPALPSAKRGSRKLTV